MTEPIDTPTPDRPVELDPAMVEKAAEVLLRDYQSQYAGGELSEFLDLARAALSAAGVPALAAEVERLRERMPCDGLCASNSDPDSGPEEDCSLHGRKPAEVWAIVRRLAAERDAALARATSAEQERDDLVARVQRQVDSAEVVKVHAGGGNLVTQRRMVDAGTLAALLSGEQPGVCPYCGKRPEGTTHTGKLWHRCPALVAPAQRIVAGDPGGMHQVFSAEGHEHHTGPGCACGQIAPAVPGSTDVRERVLHVLASHGIEEDIFEGEGSAVGLANLVTDLLAVAGQGVTSDLLNLAEWHETKADKARRFPGEGNEAVMEKAAQVHEDAARRLRAVVRSGEQGGEDRG